MTLYGVDVHPNFQAGLNIEQVRKEGFDFIAVKLSEATGTYPGRDWLQRAKACGLLSLGYHYLRPGNEVEQARVFSEQLLTTDVPGMLDAEALALDGKTATLTISGVRRFLDACTARGVKVPLVYLPRWYWSRIGSPSLTGLPALWGSSYVNGSGYASDLYEAVTPSYWAHYGGLPVTVLQFTDRAKIAGQAIDADAFAGTRDQFAALIGSDSSPPPTPLPASPESIPFMEYGETSDAIRHLQGWLNATFTAYSHIAPVSGYYGSQTTAVVKEFQRRVGIIGGDGRNVGDLTRAKLFEHGFCG